MKKNIRKEKFYPLRPEDVWEALTDPKEISAWLMPTTEFVATVGVKFMLQAKPMGKWDGKIYGEILIADKPRVLSYTWKGDQMKSNTILTWTLVPQDSGTLLKLEHTGFEGFSDVVLGLFHAMGWGKFLRQLYQRLINKQSYAKKEV
ncbi:hypothetical protein WSM22_24640 [Cytophagales bacterium WSM2-2]|nr:hypothetical protein WSM22_24640 [Cytophagales bacterium WSM2-2]